MLICKFIPRTRRTFEIAQLRDLVWTTLFDYMRFWTSVVDWANNLLNCFWMTFHGAYVRCLPDRTLYRFDIGPRAEKWFWTVDASSVDRISAKFALSQQSIFTGKSGKALFATVFRQIGKGSFFTCGTSGRTDYFAIFALSFVPIMAPEIIQLIYFII